MTTRAVLGVDVGGTSIKALLTRSDGESMLRLQEPTPRQDPDGTSTLAAIASMVEEAGTYASVEAVGIVVPGVVDESQGVCIQSVNLGWIDLPVRRLAEERMQLPVAFGHDVRAGALAEARTGASRTVEGVAAFIPIGTGIAGAFTLNGSPVDLGARAGEFGQHIIEAGEFAGCRVEEIASASGIARRAGQNNALRVAELVRHGDARAIRVWDDAIAVLAQTLSWVVLTVGSGVVVLGGGLCESPDLIFPRLEEALGARMPASFVPELRHAAHGTSAAAIGAAEMAFATAVAQ